MHILVTAGNTQAPIDRVRCVTNIFSGRTGAAIAQESLRRGHQVTLLTSHPEVMSESSPRLTVHVYRTFDDLARLMETHIKSPAPDVVIHSAAVSDYLVSGVYSPDGHTHFTPDGHWHSAIGTPAMWDRSAGKVKSDVPELWLRLTRAPKLIDRIRSEWAFKGVLVKFKLEVGCSDEELLKIAERSRRHSEADLMVANTLEGASVYAFLGPLAGHYERVGRAELAGKLLDAIEARQP